MTKKEISLSDFLTDDEIRRCVELYKIHHGGKSLTDLIENQIIKPNLSRINAALGQENDSRYLAYAVEYVMTQMVP